MDFKNDSLNMAVLFGSPHNNSYTYHLYKAFDDMLHDYAKKHYPHLNININFFDAYKLNISPCLGCRLCHREKQCCYRDFDEITQTLKDADIIVFCSPIYYMSFPAPLKAIIDRTQSIWSMEYIHKNSIMSDKLRKGVLLLTSGSDILNGADIVRRQTNSVFRTLNTKTAGSVIYSGTDHDPKPKISDRLKREINNCILNIFE